MFKHSNLKKLRKFIKSPKRFFLDSKFYLNKSKQKLNSHVKKLNKDNRNTKNIYMINTVTTNKNPIIHFNFSTFIKILNSYEIKGVYIEPLEKKAKYILCILSNDKVDFLEKLLRCLYNENIQIAYKINGQIKKPRTVNEICDDIFPLKCLEVRLTTTRNLGTAPGKLWFKLEFCDNNHQYIQFPSANYISRRCWKDTAATNKLFQDNIKPYTNILKHSHEQEFNFDIDLVFTWVNSDDPDWKELYKQYKPNCNTDATSESRYVSRDELKYALRSWEKYGSFIRKIFIVSNCKPPVWLNLNHPKINWVYHESIMPHDVLPTFSSHAIETSLHKIPGLSNFFIYSNDDFLLVKPLSAYNFYYPNGIAKIRLEHFGNVNGQPSEEAPDYLNAARNSNILLEKEFGKTPTQLHTHSPQSMRVDILNEMQVKYQEYFNKTMSNKFRSLNDISVTGYFYHHYAFLSARAIQSTDETELIQQNHNFVDKFNKIISLYNQNNTRELPMSVCINDGNNSHLNDKWNKEVKQFLETLFPSPSSFENF